MQAGVFEQIEQPDEQSGPRLVSLADIRLVAAQLPVDEAATQRELAEIEDGVPIGSEVYFLAYDPEFGRDRLWPALAECVAVDIDPMVGRADADGQIS